MWKSRDMRGFTLIELLIVVAIIAILALIAVPNFLEAQTRARVSRVETDMRTLATAVEAYRVDYNAVPPWDSWSGADTDQDRLNLRIGYFWRALTSPISYITSPPRDTFVSIGTRSQQHIVNDTDQLDPWIQVGVGFLGPDDDRAPRLYWCACSYGPDHVDDTGSLGRYPYTGHAIPYDPTNGTVSWGDIHRHSGKPPTNFLSDLDSGNDNQNGFNPWW